MASRHRVLWRVAGVGQLRCLKKDPTKLSFWIETWVYTKDHKHLRHGPFYLNLQNHLHYKRKHFEAFIRRMILYVSKEYENRLQFWNQQEIERIGLALDYLFAVLGRLAEKTMIS
jgi:hypothetical protein